MKFSRNLIFALLLLWSEPIAMAAPQDEIAALAQAQSEAFNQGNVDWYVEAFADDAVLSPPGGSVRAIGKDAIKTAMVAFFRAFPSRESVPHDTIVRLYNNATVAIRNELRDEKLVDRNGETRTQKTRFTQVLVRAGDRWLVVEQHNSRIPIPPGQN